MLDSTIELISLVASNSLAVFCLCNLIIAIIIAGSSKPTSEFHEKKPFDYDNVSKYTVYSCEKANALIHIEEEQKAPSVSTPMTDNEEESLDNDNDDGSGGEEEEEEELRKRVEEFIEKINTSWRAEKLSAYSLKSMTYH